MAMVRDGILFIVLIYNFFMPSLTLLLLPLLVGEGWGEVYSS
jgi:hypothetical protein